MPEIQTVFNPNLIDLDYEEELIFFNHLINISSKEMLRKNYYLDLFRIKQNENIFLETIKKSAKILNVKLSKEIFINKPKLIFHFNSFIKKDFYNYPLESLNKNFFRKSFKHDLFLAVDEISGFDLQKNIFLFYKGLTLSNYLNETSNFNERNLIFIYCFFTILKQVVDVNNKKSLKELKISEIINVFTYLNVSFFSTIFDFSEFSKQSFILNRKNQN